MTGTSGILSKLFGRIDHPSAVANPHKFLHARVTLYSKTLFALCLFFTTVALSKLVAPGLLPAPAVASAEHAKGTLATFAVLTAVVGFDWRYLSRKLRPMATLHAYETIGTIGVCAGLSLVVHLMPPQVPEIVVAFLMVLVLVLRAAIVPSTPLLTAIVGMAATGVFVAAVWWRTRLLGLQEDPIRGAMWGAVCAVGSLFVVATAVVSRIIYGLQQTLREALQLGQYTLETKLGQGGMGTVYLARHALLRRPTAVKVLTRERAGSSAAQRFEREVRETSRLRHPNTIEIYDFGYTQDGVFYYAMEYLDGLDLERLVERYGPLPSGRAVHLLTQVAHALAEAHGAGLIHRDIKPANIMVCNKGGVPDFAKVVDFGLVKNLKTPTEIDLSATDTLAGTPLYMAPETIAAPELVDPRSDIYALGCVAWFLLTGKPPFSGTSVVEVCAKHLYEVPLPPSAQTDGSVPPELDAIVLRCMHKEPSQRFESALDLWTALRACTAANSWSGDDALAWWRAHQDEVSRSRVQLPTSGSIGVTLPVTRAARTP